MQEIKINPIIKKDLRVSSRSMKLAAIGFLGRDNEQKIIGITAFIVGVAIFFAPQIVNAVVGQTIF